MVNVKRGSTIRDLVTERAATTPTAEELTVRGAAAAAYLREQVCPDLDDADVDAGRGFAELRARDTRPSGHDR